MMRTIHLYGRLAKVAGKQLRLDVDTAADAIRGIVCNFPSFEDVLRKGSYHVVVGPRQFEGVSLDLDHVRAMSLGEGDLHIMPAVAGSKNSGGLLKVLLGVALVGVSLFMGVGTAFAGGLGMGATWGHVALVGAGLALFGVSQMLTGEEKEEKSDESFTLAGPTNGYSQGEAVPIAYGRTMIGTKLIHGGLDIEQIGSKNGSGANEDKGKPKSLGNGDDETSENDAESGSDNANPWDTP